jgi:hypothetical protein
MDLNRFLFGRGSFKSAEEIIGLVARHDSFDRTREDAASAGALVIFQTSKQQTWLIATRAHLYCVLDDLNKAFTRVQWTMPAETIVASGNVIVPISTLDKTEKTGLLTIGDRRRWLYTKRLFAPEGIEARIRSLISTHMLNAAIV